MLKKWGKVIKLFVYPPFVLFVFLLFSAGFLLIYTSTSEKSHSLIGYISYTFTVYVLITVICRIQWCIKQIANAVQRHPITGRFLIDIPYRVQISLFISLIANAAYAIIKLIFGIMYSSTWFITISVYYLLLCSIRFLLLGQTRYFTFGKNKAEEYKQYRRCGMLLIVLNITLSGMTIQMVRNHQSYKYPGHLIYAVALYAFYAIIAAGANVVRYRKLKSPIISAAQALNFTTALVSVLSLQTAMLTQFNRDPSYEKLMNGITSCVICIFIIGIAFYMIAHATMKLHDLDRIESSNP